MGRDDADACITVPSFFRCPISLDVMRSPVSLCTGVTYDRASIQRWLDGGNNTCPATMQVLQSRELVPNWTLQRLIEVWSDSVRRHVAGSPSPASDVPTKEEADDVLAKLNLEKDDENRLEMLSRIIRFARESEENREFLARNQDFVPMLVDFMAAIDAATATNTKMELVKRAITILEAIRSSNGVDRERLSNLMLMSDRDCLTAILLAFQRGNLETKIESARVLESIGIAAESKLMIAERKGMLQELIKSISTESDPRLIEASLSCLIAISERVRSRLIAAKSIAKLKDLLLTETTNVSVAVTEKALKLLETLSSRREGRSEICGGKDEGDDGACVKGVVRKLLKVSTAATEHAVAILWCVCYVFREEKAKEAVEKSNGVTKILVVMQSNCSPAVRQMSKDLLKVFKVNCSSRLAGYDTKTTHIMPF